MKITKISLMASFIFAALISAGAVSSSFAQGKGKGKPVSAGNVSGNPSASKGQGSSPDYKGKGKSNDSSENSSKPSAEASGRNDAGKDRATVAREKAAKLKDTELNRYRGLSKKIGSTPEEMRSYYEKALMENPKLSYGNFVAANVIADNLHDKNSAITSDAILAGLARGDSIGQTLQKLGLSKRQAETAKRDADRKIKENTKKNQ